MAKLSLHTEEPPRPRRTCIRRRSYWRTSRYIGAALAGSLLLLSVLVINLLHGSM